MARLLYWSSDWQQQGAESGQVRLGLIRLARAELFEGASILLLASLTESKMRAVTSPKHWNTETYTYRLHNARLLVSSFV